VPAKNEKKYIHNSIIKQQTNNYTPAVIVSAWWGRPDRLSVVIGWLLDRTSVIGHGFTVLMLMTNHRDMIGVSLKAVRARLAHITTVSYWPVVTPVCLTIISMSPVVMRPQRVIFRLSWPVAARSTMAVVLSH